MRINTWITISIIKMVICLISRWHAMFGLQWVTAFVNQYLFKPMTNLYENKVVRIRDQQINHPDTLLSLFFSLSSLLAAGLMHTFNAHAATDITGFGILGHAQTLARQQRSEVSFVIHNLPVLAKMAAVSKACGNMFGLMHGTCPETSGVCVYFALLFSFFPSHCLFWMLLRNILSRKKHECRSNVTSSC